ncbi:MAG: endonuclease III domain-containing protein [Nitrospirae bacterium]|nr:endonuclease III domain-containing protein [Candidatus Troglogloeales bacterium]MBI3598179.1 endonuclease III domain-containing protein [Candidatus Troglogloeales bacterium]
MINPSPPSVDLLKIYHRLYTAFGPQHWWPAASRFEVIVGAILTQNTSWKNVEKALKSLKDNTPSTSQTPLLENGEFNPKWFYDIPRNQLARLIRASGFYNLKASRLKAFMTFLYDEYGGALDRMFLDTTGPLRRKLLKVSGLGPETVDSILLYAGDKPYFVVDAYTRRVFSRHALVNEKASYSEIQDFFMKRLPLNASLFNEYHALIVNVGKKYCKTKPDCERCPLAYLFNE